MFNTLSNAFKVKDLRKKLIYTLMMLWVIRIGAFITIPGINKAAVANTLGGNDLIDLFNTFSGGALKNMSLFALGIVPYINASIVMSLLTIVIPKLEEMQKEGEDGRKKIAKITRYATVGFAALQAFGITVGLGRSNWFYNFTGANILIASTIAILALTAGTAFLMWIGERITENGIGNGISFIIFVNILSALPDGVKALYNYTFKLGKPIQVILLLIVFVAMIVLVIMLQLGERRIPVQYAKRMQGRKVYGGQTTYIPVRVNTAGVIPVIFASSLLQFPYTITALITQTPNATWAKVINFLKISSLSGAILYFLLIIGFTYFYSSITFNPIEVANNMKKNSGSIPGLRPGKPTSDYLIAVMNRITLVGALVLGVIAVMPVILANSLGVNVTFGGTSLIIVVGVALDTVKQIEAQLVMRNYKGFLK